MYGTARLMKWLRARRALTEWQHDCLFWRGVVLNGLYRHWCPEWDDLPMDETCKEWPCGCRVSTEAISRGASCVAVSQ